MGQDDEVSEVVLKVDMHCESCARKMTRALKGVEGVVSVVADTKEGTVVVKGKHVDSMKLCERLEKKSGRKVEIISPLPPEPEENKPEEEEDKAEEPKASTTTVLRIGMHCESCAQVVQRRVSKIEGVESVETDFANGRVTVTGVVEPADLVEHVYKRTKKQASVVVEEEESKANEEKTEEEKKESEEEEKEEVKRNEVWVPSTRFFIEHALAPHIFSDENPNACCAM